MISSDVKDSLKTSGVLANGGQNKANNLGKEAFMRLLVTQLQNQDPLKPMEDKEFTAQLAQFSSLEEMQNISKSIESLVASQTSSTKTNSVGFIGKEVTATGGYVRISAGNAGLLNYGLEKAASEVDVNIRDASGKLVRVLQKINVPAGNDSVSWDGRDSSGNRLPDGDYTFDVGATDIDGGVVRATARMTGIVSSVKYELGEPYLMIGSMKVPLQNVMEVR